MSTSKLQSALELTFPAALAADVRDRSAAAEERVLALFDETAPAVRRYVASFNVAGASTDDIVQDVYLALFRHLSLGRPDTNLKGWLFQVAHNLALKQRQRSARRGTVEGAWDAIAAEQLSDDAWNPERRLSERQRQRRLREALMQLPDREQRCIHLRAAGLGYRDIAKTLGISLGSVAKSVARALGQLAAADVE